MKTWKEVCEAEPWRQLAQETPEATILHVMSSQLLMDIANGNNNPAHRALVAAVYFLEEAQVPPELLGELEEKLKQRKALSEQINDLNRKLPEHLQRYQL